LKILITGGLGFIGGRLMEYLISNTDYNIIIATRGNASKYPLVNNRVKLFKVNWLNSDSLINMCEDVDVIIHAAGMNAKDCFDNPIKADDFNGNSTKKLVDAAIIKRVKRIIYISTAHVYCSPLIGDISEKTIPINSHPYATSHILGENHILKANKAGFINGIVLRLSNSFGRPLRPDTDCWMLVINDLCKQIAVNNKITIKNNANQVRDFISISEVCKVINHFINIKKTDVIEDNIYNVGTGKSRSIFEIGDLIKTIAQKIFNLNPSLELSNIQSSSHETQNLNFHICKLENTGIKIETNLDSEIIDLINYTKSNFTQ
jgi:UDP-glucose 4-epimerase